VTVEEVGLLREILARLERIEAAIAPAAA